MRDYEDEISSNLALGTTDYPNQVGFLFHNRTSSSSLPFLNRKGRANLTDPPLFTNG
jgi:hypothetical protein